MIIIIALLSSILILSIYACYNLMRKNEKLEEIVISQKDYTTKLSNQIEIMDKKIKVIDSRGTFTSDDEIGWFFKEIKSLQEQLNQFKLR
jgi:hypothetical protein